MKWLFRKLKEFFAVEPFIQTGEKHWLSDSHYQRYKAFQRSLRVAYLKYSLNGIEGYQLHSDNASILTILQDVRSFLFRNFIYTPDGEIDNWEVPNLTPAGKIADDCDGHAVFALLLLMLEGIDRSQLRLATCWADRERTEYHMVLVVHTYEGDYVVDNRWQHVWRWDSLDYQWHYMEDGNGGFVEILNG
jgi:predicted transglutaminase-like cysteine proteinase